MERIDIQAIERQARAMRSAEIQRLQGLFAERASLYAVLMGHSLLNGVVAVGELIRPLLTWNPQDKRKRSSAC